MESGKYLTLRCIPLELHLWNLRDRLWISYIYDEVAQRVKSFTHFIHLYEGFNFRGKIDLFLCVALYLADNQYVITYQ